MVNLIMMQIGMILYKDAQTSQIWLTSLIQSLHFSYDLPYVHAIQIILTF